MAKLFNVSSSPHVRSEETTRSIMMDVAIAMLPATAFGVFQFGLHADKISVTQTGCIGICQYEPVVEVFEDGKDKVTYVKMTADKAKRVVAEHLKGGKPVEEYVIGNK